MVIVCGPFGEAKVIMVRWVGLLGAIALLLAAAILPARAGDQRFVLAAATSADNAGLLDAIVPQFTRASGISVRIVAVGTGQAFEMARRGDAAAILVHDRDGEMAFVASGAGSDRRDVMENDFVLIGPREASADLVGADDMAGALVHLARSGAPFVSRGDDSGTHRQEMRLWARAGLDPPTFGQWYRQTGAGMGQTIMTATQMDALTLSDRATWTRFAAKGDHVIVFAQEPPLRNPYASILATHAAIPPAQRRAARQWHDWLTGNAGRAAINAYRFNGMPMFRAPDPPGSG